MFTFRSIQNAKLTQARNQETKYLAFVQVISDTAFESVKASVSKGAFGDGDITAP